jgi:predicted DNA-binding protein
MRKPEQKNVNLYMPAGMKDTLEQLADQKGVNLSQLIRFVLREYINLVESDPEETNKII